MNVTVNHSKVKSMKHILKEKGKIGRYLMAIFCRLQLYPEEIPEENRVAYPKFV